MTQVSRSEMRSYYSGDALSFNNQLYVTSANSGSLEVFRLDGRELVRLAAIKPFDARFNRYGEFYDAALLPDGNRLYVLAISGFSLYKYELVGDKLALVDQRQNTYWEWYNRVDRHGDQIVTISEKGIKYWNIDIMDVIDSLPLNNSDEPYNLRSSQPDYLLNVDGGQLRIYDRTVRSEQSSIALNFKTPTGNRQAYQDEDRNLYVVDDYYAKKFNLDGQLLASFRHIDQPGYDITGSGHTDYVYFTNGEGVVKLKKNDLKKVVARSTMNVGGPQGWAMGLEVAYTSGGDKLVIFNNSNILILNDKLEKLASFAATAGAEPTAQENLFLDLDRAYGSPQATVQLNGGGFFPQETLSIDFAGQKTTATAESRGRVARTLKVPAQDPDRVDIKVTEEDSGLHYSIAFDIK